MDHEEQHMKRNGVYKYLMLTTGLLVLATMILSPVAKAATFQLLEDTEIKVQLNNPVSSADAKVGDVLMITLAEPIKIGDQLLIAEGASGKAVVSEVEKAKAPGKPGKLVIEFQELGTRGSFKTTDGAAIELGGTAERAGKGKKTLAFVTIVGIFLIKGGQGEITVNETLTAKIAATTVLTSD